MRSGTPISDLSFRRSTARLLWRLAMAACAALCAVPLAAQTPTPEQMQMLQSLPPEQRNALLEQLGMKPAEQEPDDLEFPDLVMDEELSLPEDEEDEEPRIEPSAVVVVEFSYPELLDLKMLEELQETLRPRVLDLIGRNVLEVNRDGVLLIDDFYRIPLAGLTAEEAASRIGAEPDLRSLEVSVTLLPLAPVGAEALTAFGRELFDGVPTTFAPATDVPVPSDYVIGPGDTVRIRLFGRESRDYELVVDRDGTLQLPEIGPVTVAGLSFEAMRGELRRLVAEQMIGADASITLGELRSIRVFVLGDATRPGSYTVSGLSTMTNALFLSGGISETGSLRRVQLKRSGTVVETLDLYALLLRGDTRRDARLQPGDVIFIPPVGPTVGVAGEVKRPAIYELNGERGAGDVVELAGGLLPTAYAGGARIERIDRDGRRRMIDVDLTTASGRDRRVRSGDVLRVDRVLEEMNASVELAGHLYRPGSREFAAGLRLSDVLPSLTELKAQADPHYILIRREIGPERRIEVLSADLTAALAAPGSAANPRLAPRDRVVVFGTDGSRAERVEPLLEELRGQARSGEPAMEVQIGGWVVAEGVFPLERQMRISDLIRAGGGLRENAYTLEAEPTRYPVEDRRSRRTELLEVDLEAVLAGDTTADRLLQPYDYLTIKEIPQWGAQESVEILGEVRFPGTYTLQRGETLRSVLSRAGGLTDLAFPAGSVFVREDLRQREQRQLENLAARLEADIVSFSLRSLQTETNATEALSIGQSLLAQLQETEATGRLVIDIEGMQANPGLDIVMKDGDQLFIPRESQEVTVLGEVQYATSHIFLPGLTRDDYIARSGGVTQKADKKRIYVVRASGLVLAESKSRWFSRSDATEIRPGDTIVVPLDADRVSTLTLFTNISQIIYQLALAAASANAVGVF